jgi:hypothetical protein
VNPANNIMKTYLKRIQLLMSIASIVTFQAFSIEAQFVTLSEVQSNAQVGAQMMQSNADVKARACQPAKSELEWVSNVTLYAKATKPWPDASKKQELLKHCSDLLRSSLNTNQIEMAYGNMTNQPDAVLVLKSFTEEITSDLDEFANLLNGSDLTSFLGEAGYHAESSNSTNLFTFGFWSENGPVQDIVQRTTGNGSALVQARFRENGNLASFDTFAFHHIQASFGEDGQIKIWGRLNDRTQIRIKIDTSGSVQVESHLINPKH